ncbi:MAG: hypothetical protein K8T10_00595 [Candidatus Eremiobacteraeota bacterium]|nr:hypothetical protein [Candidatus Eremiobacteraeota bacterium]
MKKNDEDLKKIMFEERAVKDLIKGKIAALESYEDYNTEILAYRLSEILITAKNLYTENFSELMEVDTSDSKKAWDVIMALRMNLLHLRDCIEDFDTMMIQLMEDSEAQEE